MNKEDLVIVIIPIVMLIIGLFLIIAPYVYGWDHPWKDIAVYFGKYIITLVSIGFLVYILVTNYEARINYLYRVAEEHRGDLIRYVVSPLKDQIYGLQEKISLFNNEKLAINTPQDEDSAINVLWQDLDVHHVKGIKDKIAEANRRLEEFMKRRTLLHEKFRDILLKNLNDLASQISITEFGIDYKQEYLAFLQLAFYVFEEDKLDPRNIAGHIIIDNKSLTGKGKIHFTLFAAFINNYRSIPLCVGNSKEEAEKCGEIVAKAIALSWQETKYDFEDLTNFVREIKQYLNGIIKDLDMFIYSKGIEFCPIIRR